jgi:uncharacterized tellurite resistance protein B-like protein
MQLSLVVGGLVTVAGLLAGGAFVAWRREQELVASAGPTPEEFRDAMLSAAGLCLEMCRADGQMRDKELAVLRQGLLEMITPVDEEFVDEMIDHAMSASISGAAIRERARHVRRNCTRDHRRTYLVLARRIAVVDGPLGDAETRLLRKLGGWFGFDEDEIERAIR